LESIEDDLEIQKRILDHERKLLRYAKVGDYAKAAGKFINYCVRLNIPLENFEEIVKSKTFKDQYISFLIEKQATIEFINDILPKLTKLDDYLISISDTPEMNSPDKGKVIKAQKEMRELEKNKNPGGMITWIRWTYFRSVYFPDNNNKFSPDDKINSILHNKEKEVIKYEEEWHWECIKPLMTIESAASAYRGSRGNLQIFSRSMLNLFIDLIQQYIRKYHQDDLEAEKKARKHKNDKKYYNEHRNSELATLDERKQVVLYLWHHLKNPTNKGIADKLNLTRWKTGRGTVGKWIKKLYNGQDIALSPSILGQLMECANFSDQKSGILWGYY
jgi:hypothetical protein